LLFSLSSYTEDEFVKNAQLTRHQYKGYLRLLQACVQGLEQSFQTPAGSGTGLASAFHVLEIAYTHFWGPQQGPVSGRGSTGTLVAIGADDASTTQGFH
jgi:hypothetical protein